MKKGHLQFLLEDMDSKFDLMLEILSTLVPLPQKVSEVDERLVRVEDDVKVIKAVVTAQGLDLKNHGIRIKKLEKAAT